MLVSIRHVTPYLSVCESLAEMGLKDEISDGENLVKGTLTALNLFSTSKVGFPL